VLVAIYLLDAEFVKKVTDITILLRTVMIYHFYSSFMLMPFLKNSHTI